MPHKDPGDIGSLLVFYVTTFKFLVQMGVFQNFILPSVSHPLDSVALDGRIIRPLTLSQMR